MRGWLPLPLAIGVGCANADEAKYPAGVILEPPSRCGDFLEALGLQRHDVKFVKCKPGKFGGIDNLQAEYRVRGKDVVNVENWLVRLAHVRRLKRACCIWETSTGGFKGRDGANYEISMGAETSVSSRRDLRKVPFFDLTVTHYLYSL